MGLKAEYFRKTFQFNFKARTSRGLMRDKSSWFVKVYDEQNPSLFGIGECGPLPGLSIDPVASYEEVLAKSAAAIAQAAHDPLQLRKIIPPEFPSLLFGFETALLDFINGSRRVVFDNEFVRGQRIPINGLIWMGDMDFMMNQINEKISLGFKCIKLKVGGLDFDRECDVLQYIRKRYFRNDITLRLDANGAFKLDEVLFRLTELSRFNIHSIEQPIKPGQEEMEELCRKSPIPVAFDEELFGKMTVDDKRQLLDRFRPKFIVLKPTMLGGFAHCAEWISLCEERGIGWWVTSALESAVGLNAICQFTANYPISIPQGLGTGAIYSNNFSSPLFVDNGFIFHGEGSAWANDFH